MLRAVAVSVVLMVAHNAGAVVPDLVWQTEGVEPLRHLTAVTDYDEEPLAIQVSNDTAPAPLSGFVVPISTSVAGVVNIPTSVKFAAGERSKSVAATGVGVGATLIAVAKNGIVAKATLELRP